MAEAAWLEQLQAFGEQVAAVGQQAAAQHGRITDWFLHQQGLFALGRALCCTGLCGSAIHAVLSWAVLSCAVLCHAFLPSHTVSHREKDGL